MTVEPLFGQEKLTLIAGPCVAESYDLCLQVATEVKKLADLHKLPYIFKASFDKANRTSFHSYRGPGLEEGLAILARVREEVGVPVLTDIHEPSQAEAVAQVADVLQIPAFLCRQTDLIAAAAKTGKPTCIKKGQFLSPEEMLHPIAKFREVGGTQVAITERGTSFGYNNLVVDMRSLATMRAAEVPIIFDATHAVQQPGAGKGTTAGDRRQAPILARAAAAVGIDGLFCEVHPSPDAALSDGPNSLSLPMLEQMLAEVVAIDCATRVAQKPQS